MHNIISKTTLSILALSCICQGCGTITSRLGESIDKGDTKIGLRQPSKDKRNDASRDTMPSFITYVDDKGIQNIITKTTTDAKTGEDITTVDLSGVTVVAKSKNISERNGKVNIDFLVTVPKKFISDKWQLQLTPMLKKNTEMIQLEKLFLSGADFIKQQRKGYRMYQNFLTSIIPDSMYMQKFFDEKGYKKAMEALDEEFYQSWKKGLLSEREFIDWKDKRNRRYILFNEKMYRNKKIITERKTWKRILPSYWLERTVDSSVVSGRWINFLSPDYKVTKKAITRQDSLEISKKYYDLKRQLENERKKSLKNEMYAKYVRFPSQKARLDTIIMKGDKFEYYYTQEINVDEAMKKLLLTLDCNVVAIDESRYHCPPTDTLTFYISSMLQFLDRTPHYKLQIVKRQAQANMTAYINFSQGEYKYSDEIGNNKNELDKVLDAMYKLTYSGELVMDSINVVATASPEGNSSINRSLSYQRAVSLKSHIQKVVKDKEGVSLLKPQTIGEDWNKLKQLISSCDELEHRQEILDIIKNERDMDKREREIQNIYPNEYAYIFKNFYPDLRAVKFEFNLHRRDMVKDTIHTTILDTEYMHALDDMENRQYKKALTVLDSYNDYNTAVCLMSLSYDQRAYDILLKCHENSNRDYLLSILSMRLKKEQEAVNWLMKSIKADETKIFRGKLDPEINQLINTYNLKFDE